MLKLRNKAKCSRALRRRCIAKEDAYETSDRLCAGAVSDGLSVFRSRSRRFARRNFKMDDAAGYERRSDRNDPCGGNGGRAEEPLAAERAYIRTQPHRPSDGDLRLDALRQKHHEQDRSLSGRRKSQLGRWRERLVLRHVDRHSLRFCRYGRRSAHERQRQLRRFQQKRRCYYRKSGRAHLCKRWPAQ